MMSATGNPNPSTLSPNTSSKRVLVVEDEAEIRQLVVLHLKREGLTVEEAGDGEEARRFMESRPYDLIVMDWMLPSLSGLELTRWWRKVGSKSVGHTPILFVTAKAEPEQIASGLDAGADDYLVKPFDTLVLMARVNALLRRQDWLRSEPPVNHRLVYGGLVIDRDAFVATLDGDKLDLTRSEFKLLETLVMGQGKVLSRESLIEQIQGEGVNVVGRTVDTHVFGLRKKLGAYSEMIETIRGVGYRVKSAQS
jgi:DNA-binding response OmpR family regulator